jgi:hypothetical protein
MVVDIIITFVLFHVIFTAYEKASLLEYRYEEMQVLVVRSILSGLLVSLCTVGDTSFPSIVLVFGTIATFIIFKEDYE